MPTTRKFVFNKNPRISSLYTIRSSDILGTIWKFLGRYKSVKYTKSILAPQLTHNSTLLNKKAEQNRLYH